jgi:hypothetical protein
MSEIFHLVYSSTASIAVTQNVIDDILMVAREKNSAQQISGLLIYRNNHFIQLLEGIEFKVHKIYNKIKKDARHKDQTILAEFHSESRLFERWNMGMVKDENESEKIAGKLELLLKNPLGLKDDMKGQVIEIFRQVNKKDL